MNKKIKLNSSHREVLQKRDSSILPQILDELISIDKQ